MYVYIKFDKRRHLQGLKFSMFVNDSDYHQYSAAPVLSIVVINVRKKIKNVKNAFFILKIKNVCKRDKKRYPLFLLAFDVEPVNKITDIN